MPPKKEKFDRKLHKYNFREDTLALLSSLLDTSFGPRMYEDLLKDAGEETVLRYQPEGWQTMEGIKNIKARFSTDNQAHKILELTYHNVAVLDAEVLPEKASEEASALINKAVTQLKKRFKEESGKPLKIETIKHKGGKDYLVSYETVNNPRVETSWLNNVVGRQMPRIYYKVSKYYMLKNEDDENVAEEYK